MAHASSRYPWRWIHLTAATPDHDLDLSSLSRHRVIPFRAPARHSWGEGTDGQVYAFGDYEGGEEDALVRRAREYILFGEELPAGIIDDGGSVITRGRTGTAQIDEEWVRSSAWRATSARRGAARKGYGLGHDRRTIGEERDARNNRFIREEDTMMRWSSKAVVETPLQGLAVVMAFFEALQTDGLPEMGHHSERKRRRGVGDRAAVAREHFHLSDALRLEVTVDNRWIRPSW